MYCLSACDREVIAGALLFAPFGAGIGAGAGALIAWLMNLAQ
jgi:hypothetical protein